MATAAGVSRVLKARFGETFTCANHPKWGEPVFVSGPVSDAGRALNYLTARGYQVEMFEPGRLRVYGSATAARDRA